MSFERPSGYRLPTKIALTSLVREAVSQGRPVRRDEAVRIIAKIAAELTMAPHRDEVLRRLSHGHVGDDDLPFSNAEGGSALCRAAEFVDVMHARARRDPAVPLDPWLDLRFEVRFYDDPVAPSGPCSYLLVSTSSRALELAWRRVPGLQRYPLPEPPDDKQPQPDDWAERAETWDRVLAPFQRSEPLSWAASDPALREGIAESIRNPEHAGALAAEGRATAELVVAEVRKMLGGSAPSGFETELTAMA